MPWVTVSLTKDDIEAFKRKEAYKFEAHVFKTDIRAGGKQYCLKCGLVALNNDFTTWSIRMGCNSESHPDYQKVRNRFTKL